MNIKEINRQIQGGKIHIKAFPRAFSTTKSLCYINSGKT